jgi:F-type H+-transporting ATPase subunit epsilon
MPFVTIASPSQTLFEGNAVSVTIPTVAGVITILDDHEALIGVLAGGELQVVVSDDMTVSMAVDAGMVQMIDNHLRIFTQDSILASELTEQMIADAQKNASELQQRLDESDDVEYAKIAAQLQKELAKTALHSRKK